MAILPWSPLAGGILAGKYTLDMLDNDAYPAGYACEFRLGAFPKADYT